MKFIRKDKIAKNIPAIKLVFVTAFTAAMIFSSLNFISKGSERTIGNSQSSYFGNKSNFITKESAKFLVSKTCKIKDVKHADRVVDALYNSSLKHGVDFQLLLAVMDTESDCRHTAVSPKGAMGLMQLTPETARWLGAKEPMSIKQNVNAGAKYLSYLLREFNGDYSLALAAYNAGPNIVKKYKNVPPYKETKGYVYHVIKKYNNFLELTKT